MFAVGVMVGVHTTIETDVQIVSATATSAAILYVLSENLRASAVKKLDYWNKRVFSPLLRITREQIWSESPGRAEALSQFEDWLKKWGKTGNVKLYPKSLMVALGTTTESAKSYDQTYKVIRKKGIEEVGGFYHSIPLYSALGMGDRGNFTPPDVDKHKTFIESLKRTNPNLVETFIKQTEFLQAQLSYLRAEIGKFYLDNMLEEVPETNTGQPP